MCESDTNMKKVIKIVKANIKKGKLKVCAYARVSKDSDGLLRSLSTQIIHFKEYIKSNKSWEFTRVYFDEGISGTSLKKRVQFNEMINDAENGKIDLILTKSVTRFARNTVDLLKTIRYLKDIGVEVRFEKENISTMSKDSELILSILASVAQVEAENISSNIKWSISKRMKEGKDQYRPTFGYDYKDGKYVINKKEANIVKLIYREFLNGKNYADITRMIRKLNIKTRRNNLFNYPQVKVILKNERYCGNAILQKSYVENPLTHSKKANKGEYPKYIAYGVAPKIIDDKDFENVQKIIKELSINRMLRHPLYKNRFKKEGKQ